MRVLAVDPGLTRCGVAVVEGGGAHRARLAHVGVLRTDAEEPVAQRLLRVHDDLAGLVTHHQPQAVVVERVFSQHNVRTVMTTAQVAGFVLVLAARAAVPVETYTPSEIKAAVTGSGRAGKAEVQAAVMRLLRLSEPPRPADAADAIALALCHLWRGRATQRLAAAARFAGTATRLP